MYICRWCEYTVFLSRVKSSSKKCLFLKKESTRTREFIATLAIPNNAKTMLLDSFLYRRCCWIGQDCEYRNNCSCTIDDLFVTVWKEGIYSSQAFVEDFIVLYDRIFRNVLPTDVVIDPLTWMKHGGRWRCDFLFWYWWKTESLHVVFI